MIKLERFLLVALVRVLVALLWRRRRFLMVLLALEVLIAFVIVLVFLAMCKLGMRLELLVYLILVMGVCEASLGLRILVALVRVRGNDRLKGVRLCKV